MASLPSQSGVPEADGGTGDVELCRKREFHDVPQSLSEALDVKAALCDMRLDHLKAVRQHLQREYDEACKLELQLRVLTRCMYLLI